MNVDWRHGTPTLRMNRHMALRLDDLNEVNRDLLAVAERLADLADQTADAETARVISEEAGRLADLSRKLSLATRSVAHVTLALLEAT